MRNGKLNKKEIATLQRAQDILNAWADYHVDNFGSCLSVNQDAISHAMNAAGGISNLWCYIEDSDSYMDEDEPEVDTLILGYIVCDDQEREWFFHNESDARAFYDSCNPERELEESDAMEKWYKLVEIAFAGFFDSDTANPDNYEYSGTLDAKGAAR